MSRVGIEPTESPIGKGYCPAATNAILGLVTVHESRLKAAQAQAPIV